MSTQQYHHGADGGIGSKVDARSVLWSQCPRTESIQSVRPSPVRKNGLSPTGIGAPLIRFVRGSPERGSAKGSGGNSPGRVAPGGCSPRVPAGEERGADRALNDSDVSSPPPIIPYGGVFPPPTRT